MGKPEWQQWHNVKTLIPVRFKKPADIFLLGCNMVLADALGGYGNIFCTGHSAFFWVHPSATLRSVNQNEKNP